MSNAASQAAAFYRQAVAEGKVWTIRDDGGFPAPIGDKGQRAIPFWSSLSRVEKTIANVSAYAAFRPHELTLEQFRKAWLLGMSKDGLLVGVNWSGPKAKGYDVEPQTVEQAIAFQIETNG